MLGGLALERAGHDPITRFRSRKTAALLAYLALYPRQHTRETLIELLWPDTAFAQGQQSLRSALTSLRHQLEPPGVRPGTVLESGRLHVALRRDAFTTDAAAFWTQAQQGNREAACALYKGPLLPGLYDDWAVLESERYTQLYEKLQGGYGALGVASVPEKNKDSPVSESSATFVSPSVLEPTRTGVPLLLDRFFGRDEELARLLTLPAEKGGLTTLLGAGGVGKTRLAVEAARRWPGPVWFVSLADCANPEDAPEHIALAMGLDGARSSLEAIGERLREAAGCLLVLDNLEQISGTRLSLLVTSLRRAAPRARFLATSRHRLVVSGEQIVSVVPLAAPETVLDAGPETLHQLAQSPGVALFVDRAQSCRGDFQLTARNAASVSSLVRLLNGVPLALELAASWIGVFTPAQIEERLCATYGWLVARHPKAEKTGRHRSLWAVASWSYDLLSPELRCLFRRLAVFGNGATTEAIAAVCELPEVEEALARLMERSLVRLAADTSEARFVLPEALREFAQERAAIEDDFPAVQTRHQVYFTHWLTQQNRSQSVCAAEFPNLLAAQQWAKQRGDDHGQTLLIRAVWRPLHHAGFCEAGLRLLADGRAAAQRCEDRRALADICMAGAVFAFMQGDYGAARQAKEEAAQQYDALGDRGRAAKARADSGALALISGQVETGVSLMEAEIAILRDCPEMAVPCFETLQNLGLAYLRRSQTGDCERAEALIGEALTRAGEAVSPGAVAYCRMALGDVAFALEKLSEAEQLYTQAATDLRNDQMTFRYAEALCRLAIVLLRQGRKTEALPPLNDAFTLCRRLNLREMLVVCVESASDFLFTGTRTASDAAKLWGCAEATRKALPLVAPPSMQDFLQRMEGTASAHPRARKAGQKLPLDEAAQLAQTLLSRFSA